ncbi:RHS repeat-associated core domain [Pseudomonas asplenii]|uniref:RHS repeat-associated core domain n=1 Tax=Pseudomonas asplenii TaxID=53407 RepID=A0A0M9GC16_9PSED|nr:RHS repeat-associated core domain-containing protein [Pseudomonas fuscovaginae]KPA87407.1 RHS repeat-associated core domain [Pseudomonas fuscovaginae]
MPTSARETLLCRYHYDPLDRLADCSPVDQASVQRFYCKSRLASEIQGTVRTRVFQYDDHLLAQHRQDANASESHLLATDTQGSVLHCLSPQQRQPSAYSAYGQRTPQNGLLSLLGFNGERPDPLTGHYLLGNGYRAFNPVLMRFNSPDSLSPFGEGGLNSYAYCQGDPVNLVDPGGHVGSPPSYKAPKPRKKPPLAPKTSDQEAALRAADKARRRERSLQLFKESQAIDSNKKFFTDRINFEPTTKITSNDDLKTAFKSSQEIHGFDQYPSIQKAIYLPDGRLDAQHFQITKKYYGRFSASGKKGRSTGSVYRTNILLSRYAALNANVDLLRAPSPPKLQLPGFKTFNKKYFDGFNSQDPQILE